MKSLATGPNYVGLVKFLVQPFLESPESLKVDCEISQTLKRTWIRIAFDTIDKGKVFGRGGRNIQAIRSVINAAAELAGQSVYLDIYGGASPGRESITVDEEQEEHLPQGRSKERESNIPKPVVKPRLR
ncbi:MAG: KH domain-containing protein [Dolichospermum sp.]